mgnify:CR=1 FL=1
MGKSILHWKNYYDVFNARTEIDLMPVAKSGDFVHSQRSLETSLRGGRQVHAEIAKLFARAAKPFEEGNTQLFCALCAYFADFA